VDFFPLMPGSYTVSEGSRPGWSATSPTSVDVELLLASGFPVRFGNQCSCSGVPGSVCGDGVQSACEQCDDGNLADGDGCNQCCGIESTECGNGVLEVGEDCDPPGSTACPSGSACEVDCTCPAVEECEQSAPMCDGECDAAGQACVSTLVQHCAIDFTACVTPADCPSPGDDCIASNECMCRACDRLCIGGTNDGDACITDAQCPSGVCQVPPCCCMPTGGPACSTDADCSGDSCVCP
jgi:cysteine-rich repeat protein